MCGRFALSIVPAQFTLAFGCEPPPGDLAPRYNIAPDSTVVVVRADPEGRREAVGVRWGMLGPWMREAGDPGRQINARAETAAEKPMFRDAFRRGGRCLIPATGFYEWQKAGGGPSRPFFVARASGEPFAFAGLWRRNRLADGSALETCAILTTAASSGLRSIHHRMPVILPEAAHAAWLDATVRDPGFLTALLEPLPDAELTTREVGRAVNNPRNEGPALLQPAPAGGDGGQRGPAQGSLL